MLNIPPTESDNRIVQRRAVVSKQCRLDALLFSLDLPTMRTKFVELTDAAADVLFGEGLDFDDVIVDRFLLADATGIAQCKVPADWLSDRDRLIEHVVLFVRNQITANDSCTIETKQIRITGLLVEIVQLSGPI